MLVRPGEDEPPATPEPELSAVEKIAALEDGLAHRGLGPAQFNDEYQHAWEAKIGMPIPRAACRDSYDYMSSSHTMSRRGPRQSNESTTSSAK